MGSELSQAKDSRWLRVIAAADAFTMSTDLHPLKNLPSEQSGLWDELCNAIEQFTAGELDDIAVASFEERDLTARAANAALPEGGSR